MNPRRLMILPLALLILGCGARPDKDQLQGSWTVVAADREGRPYPGRIGDQLVFAGDKVTVKAKIKGASGKVLKEASREYAYQLMPTKTPKEIDMTSTDAQPITLYVIYHLDGDTLKMCVPGPGEGRPNEFVTKVGSSWEVQTLKRDQP